MTTAPWKAEKLFWLFLLLLVAPWAYLAARMAANSDILWLCTALSRILQGGTMSGDAFEGNPPLSLFTCLPPLLLSKLGLPLANAITLYAMAAIILSTAAIVAILRRWDILDRQQIAIMAAGFAVSQTVMSSNTYIGERDQLIGLALAPLLLIQLALTDRRPWPRKIGWVVMPLAGFLIMIKPHYGLLPTLLILHRAVVQRRLSVIRDPDFLCLAGVTIASIAATWLFFPDWISTVMPDFVRLYTVLRHTGILRETLGLGVAGALLAGALFFFVPKGEARRLAIILALAAIVCLVPFYVQGRGYYYHLFPAFGFFGMGAGLLANSLLARDCGPRLAPFLAAAILAGAAYAVIPPDTHYPTHRQYAAFPLTRLVATCDGRGGPCPFFMFNDTMGILQETAYYAGAPHASRFPSFWFLPRLVDLNDKGISAEDRTRLFHKYALMTAADLDRYRPPLVLIGRFDVAGRPFDFVRYFSAEPAFARAFDPYKFQRRMILNRRVYNFGTLLEGQPDTPFDIYVRN